MVEEVVVVGVGVGGSWGGGAHFWKNHLNFGTTWTLTLWSGFLVFASLKMTCLRDRRNFWDCSFIPFEVEVQRCHI